MKTRRWARLVAVAALVVAGSAAAQRACPWPEPARDPFRGDPAAAVMRLTEVPEDDRRMLAAMVSQQFNRRVVHVGREHVDEGRLGRLRNMNFGAGRVCEGYVDRSSWPAGRNERAIAYVHGRWAVLVFLSCGNVALADNLEALPAPAAPSREALAQARGPVISFAPDGGLVVRRTVSEPGGALLAALGAGLAVLVRRGRRMGRPS